MLQRGARRRERYRRALRRPVDWRPGQLREEGQLVPELSTAELLAAAGNGDSAAWNELVERYSRLVWAVARGFSLSTADAADVSQTTWLRLVEHLGALREPEHLGGSHATNVFACCEKADARFSVWKPTLTLSLVNQHPRLSCSTASATDCSGCRSVKFRSAAKYSCAHSQPSHPRATTTYHSRSACRSAASGLRAHAASTTCANACRATKTPAVLSSTPLGEVGDGRTDVRSAGGGAS